jgi:hypothetical protein
MRDPRISLNRIPSKNVDTVNDNMKILNKVNGEFSGTRHCADLVYIIN